MQRAFTIRYNGLARVLKTDIGICLPHTPEEAQTKTFEVRKYVAIWDTGATGSVITKKVADDLGLKPISLVEIHHAAGKSLANVYFVNIALPGGVMFPNVRATEANLIGDNNVSEDQHPQVLIGMDIISVGDFAVTNFNGKTTFSFRVPSSAELDFVPQSTEHNVLSEGNRKDRRIFLAKKRKGKI